MELMILALAAGSIPLVAFVLVFFDAKKLGMSVIGRWFAALASGLTFPVGAIIYFGYRSGVIAQRQKQVA